MGNAKSASIRRPAFEGVRLRYSRLCRFSGLSAGGMGISRQECSTRLETTLPEVRDETTACPSRRFALEPSDAGVPRVTGFRRRGAQALAEPFQASTSFANSEARTT